MRRMTWTAAILLSVALVLAACGTKDAESVIKDLDKKITSMESYQGSGTMTLKTSQQPLEYKVEVSYQKPQYYRIKLTNEEKDITQIVLRNDDGVFVLTPKLNKVFRFQSDWPQDQGQVYLYQTLIQSILLDNSREFAIEENAYVFDVMANYNNGSLARQKIWLNKADYKPVQVEVSDSNAATMVQVKFDSFDFGAKFDKTVFDTEANMKAEPSSNQADEPTITLPEDEDDSAVREDDSAEASESEPQDDNAVDGDDHTSDSGKDALNVNDDATSGAVDEDASEFMAMKPFYMPEGVSELDMNDIVFGGNPGLMTRYTGDYSYTLVQTVPKDEAVSLTEGMLMDLGFTVGQHISGEDHQTLIWTYEGSQFRLTSSNLPETEMIKIAQSVQGEIGK